MLLKHSFAYTVHDLQTHCSRPDRSCGLIPMATPVLDSQTKYLSSEFTNWDVVYCLVAMASSSTSGESTS